MDVARVGNRGESRLLWCVGGCRADGGVRSSLEFFFVKEDLKRKEGYAQMWKFLPP